MTRRQASGVLLAMTALLLPLAACDKLTASARHHDCQLKGEIFRYRQGQRLEPVGEQTLAFKLTIAADGQSFKLAGAPSLPEMNEPRAVLDKARSSEAESTYLFDAIDATTRQRVVTSLVLNTVSGDARMFHHRWTPPVEWRDSDQYMLRGNCAKAKG